MEEKSFSVHHLVPRSRIPEEYIQKLNPVNTQKRENYIHEAWHKVFLNLNPFEVLVLCLTVIYPNVFISAKIVVRWEDILFDSFVLGDKRKIILKKSFSEKDYLLLRTIFGKKKSPLEIVEIVIRDWSPKNYFYFVEIMDFKMNSVVHYSSQYKENLNII